ncbi:hypothetical protein D9M71_825760 [compost metagenome]
MLVAGADHANDLECRQRGDFIGIQAQRASGQYRIDTRAVGRNGFGPLGGGRRQNQVKALMFENRQVIIDRFNQYQNGCGHTGLLWLEYP